MTHLRRVAFLLILCALCGRSPAAEPVDRPIVLHLPGIGGHMAIDDWMTDGLRRDHAIDLEIYDWTGESRGLEALLNIPRHRAESGIVAERIKDLVQKYPGRALHLTAHSGGTGIAVWALEKLPADVKIESLTLLASALSPTYDLGPALRHVKRAYAFNSKLDVVLNFGTKTVQTIDGLKTESGGAIGFTMPDAHEKDEYTKLLQFPYDPAWLRLGNIGDHIGVMGYRFSEKILAPLILEGVVPMAKHPATREARTATENTEDAEIKN